MKESNEHSLPDEQRTKVSEATSLGLTEKEEAVLAALLSSPTIKQAAAQCKVSETTIWRYLQNPAFMEEYRSARRRVVEHAVCKLQQDAGAATAVLLEVAKDKDATASARISAARIILEQSIRAIERDEFEARLARIEKYLERKSQEEPLLPDEE